MWANPKLSMWKHWWSRSSNFLKVWAAELKISISISLSLPPPLSSHIIYISISLSLPPPLSSMYDLKVWAVELKISISISLSLPPPLSSMYDCSGLHYLMYKIAKYNRKEWKITCYNREQRSTLHKHEWAAYWWTVNYRTRNPVLEEQRCWCREWICGHRAGRGWDELRKEHWSVYTAMCKIDS